jgi:hypothetical protein
MRNRHPQQSLGHRVLRLSLTWLYLGAVTGIVNGQATGGGIAIVSMMIGGMIALTIPGLFLGVIGGDARGSLVGAAGGLLGCWLVKLGGAVAIQPHVVSTIVILGGLLGATGFLFMRFLFWKYGMIFRTFCWLIDLTPVLHQVSALHGRLRIPRRMAANSVPHKIHVFALREHHPPQLQTANESSGSSGQRHQIPRGGRESGASA